MRCPDHTAYKGQRELTKRKCSGCAAVRMEYLDRLKKNKSTSKGTHRSISTPGINCTLAHLLTEIALFVSYGPLSQYFWRKGVSSETIRTQFQKTYGIVSGMLRRQGEDMIVSMSRFLRNSYSHLKINTIVDDMQNEHNIEVAKEERGIEAEKQKGEAVINKGGLNMFLDKELLDGATKKEFRSS